MCLQHLPAMGELRAAPTRSLDKFESLGLTAVRHGDDLFISRDGETIRMIGAIRSTKQCVACHGGERGDLLGRFRILCGTMTRFAPHNVQ